MEGSLLENLFSSASVSELVIAAEHCGATLATLASHRFERSGQFGPGLDVVEEYGRPSRFVPEYIRQGLFSDRAEEHLGTELRDALWQTVERTSPSLSVLDGRYSLLHADFKRSNLIMTASPEGWKVAAVLDWEFACSGPAIVDVGIFLRAGRRLPQGFRRAFESGYIRAGGWLSDNWYELARLVDVMSQVTFLNDTRNRPHVVAEVTSVLRETLGLLA